MKFPRLGHLAAYITSEDISTVAGNIEEISSMGGAVCCTYCKLGNFPGVAVNTGNFLAGWGRLLHILQVRKFPWSCCEHRKFPRWLGQVAAHIASEEISTVTGAANFYFIINWNLYGAISIHKMFKSATQSS